MAVRNLNLPSFPKFEVEDVSTIPTRWEKYKKRFEILCTAIGVTEAKQKLSMLFTFVGDETYEIYENIMPPGINDKTKRGKSFHKTRFN